MPVHLSIIGISCAAKWGAASWKELVAEEKTHTHELQMIGFPRADMRALYRPDWVALQGQGARRIVERHGCPEELRPGVPINCVGRVGACHYAGYRFMGQLAQLSGRPSLVDACVQGVVEALVIPPEQLRALLVAEAGLGERVMRALILRRFGLLESG
jgi:hypothetical protein